MYYFNFLTYQVDPKHQTNHKDLGESELNLLGSDGSGPLACLFVRFWDNLCNKHRSGPL